MAAAGQGLVKSDAVGPAFRAEAVPGAGGRRAHGHAIIAAGPGAAGTVAAEECRSGEDNQN